AVDGRRDRLHRQRGGGLGARVDLVMIAGRSPLDEISGGHSSYVRSHARAATMAGFTPHIVCVGRDDATIETAFGIIHQAASPYRPFRQMLAGLHAPYLAAAIARLQPRIIHSFGVWGIAATGFDALRIQSSYTTYRDEALSHVRGTAAYGLRARLRFLALYAWVAAVAERWERRAYREADVVLVNYESVARLIRGRHGVASRIIAYAAESAFSDDGARTKMHGIPSIVTIARHEPRKGNDVLLRALATIDLPFRAKLIGGGPLLDEHRALAPANVDVAGIVDDARPFLAAADIFVLSSREEQSGSLALLEALQHGAAIIAPAVDGILEDLTDGDNALLTPPGDVDALAAAITRVLTEGELRRRLQRRARETFEQRFSAAKFSAALGDVYRMRCASSS
ncbi:MAG TPA: glycosyltransferase family 4 protein, partial [Thermoanaerobaculia bacterium]|nr:glycosyltransferase family 4 protein [Thermoanaerobaculia bacterium]